MFIYARAYDLIIAALWYARRYNAFDVAFDATVDDAVKAQGIEAISYKRINRITRDVELAIDPTALPAIDITSAELADFNRAIGDGAARLAQRATSCTVKIVAYSAYIANHLSPAHRFAEVYRAQSAEFWS